MAGPREIPGFYYDEEKKKYFQIQPNHASSTGSAYTVDGVKRRKENTNTAKEESVRSTVRQRLTKRSSLLQDPLNRESISRESTAYSTSSRSDILRTLINGWQATEILYKSNPENWIRPAPVSAFAYDMNSRDLYYGDPSNLAVVKEHSSGESPELDPTLRFNASRRRLVFPQNDMGAGITAIEIEPVSKLLLAAWGGGLGGTNVGIWPLPNRQSRDQYAGQLFTIGRVDLDINAACTTRIPAVYLFAICSSRALHVIDQQCYPRCIYQTQSDLLSIEFFDAHNLLSGARNGHISLHDTRTSGRGLRVTHPSAVRHIKQLNDHQIVVAGLHSALGNYDLRYCKELAPGSAWPDHASRRNQPNDINKWTIPVVTYPDYRNDPYLDLGFDVDREDHLVAAVVDASASMGYLDKFQKWTYDSDRIKVFSSATGALLRTLHPVVEGDAVPKRTKAVKFVLERGEGQPKDLWAANGAKIINFSW